MGEEADTETFAFQAEINQLLSLIINVSHRVFCKVERSLFSALFLWDRFLMTTTSVFSSSMIALWRADATFSLSLSLSFRTTDVLLEQRDLFARTHQVRKKQSFPFRSSKRRRGVKTRSIFLQAAGDDSVSDPIGKDIISSRYMCSSFLALCTVYITKTNKLTASLLLLLLLLLLLIAIDAPNTQ